MMTIKIKKFEKMKLLEFKIESLIIKIWMK